MSPKQSTFFYTKNITVFNYLKEDRKHLLSKTVAYRKHETLISIGNMKKSQRINKQIHSFSGSRHNPNGYDGKPMHSKICESTLPFAKDCPHKNSSAYVAEFESSDVILFTSNQKKKCIF